MKKNFTSYRLVDGGLYKWVSGKAKNGDTIIIAKKVKRLTPGVTIEKFAENLIDNLINSGKYKIIINLK